MRPFDTFAMVDWSGGADTGARPRKDAIWACVADAGGGVAEPVYLRNRAAARDWLHVLLAGELAAGRRLLAGFDFPFGYPAGFAKAVTGQADPFALWAMFAAALDGAPSAARFDLAGRLNGHFPGLGPFWFNGLGREVAGLPRKGGDRRGDWGLAEKRLAELAAPGSFACWQMGGAGAVGSQAMTGMAALAGLRRAFPGQVAAWPFEPLEAPVALVEVWPSLIAGEVAAEIAATGETIKDRAQVRVLARAVAAAQEAGTLTAMLAEVPEAARREEGWILGAVDGGGQRSGAVLARAAAGAARARRTPDPVPPRLSNDCFALPQGVEWTPVETALAHLRANLIPVTGREIVAIAGAAGRVLADPAVACRSNPPGANSAVDGYGFAAASARPAGMPLCTGRAAAGAPFGGAVPEGHAMRVLTGALLPKGVDTVVLQEDCAVAHGRLAFAGILKKGANTRRAGEDVAEGAEALPAGRVLTVPDLALLTALGLTGLAVRARLRVGILSTGDELAEPGESADPARTYDANRPMLLALAGRWNHEAVDLGRARDDRAALRETLDAAAWRCDAILTSGGASAGEEDHVSALLAAEGRVQHWRIALKPGRPLILGLWRGVPVFGLPGNPVAAFVCALIFARPALSLLAGAGWAEPLTMTVPAAFEKRKKAGRREFLRARLNAEGHAEVFGSEGSGRISGLSWATGLVDLPEAAADLRRGDPVRFLPYAGFGL